MAGDKLECSITFEDDPAHPEISGLVAQVLPRHCFHLPRTVCLLVAKAKYLKLNSGQFPEKIVIYPSNERSIGLVGKKLNNRLLKQPVFQDLSIHLPVNPVSSTLHLYQNTGGNNAAKFPKWPGPGLPNEPLETGLKVFLRDLEFACCGDISSLESE